MHLACFKSVAALLQATLQPTPCSISSLSQFSTDPYGSTGALTEDDCSRQVNMCFQVSLTGESAAGEHNRHHILGTCENTVLNQAWNDVLLRKSEPRDYAHMQLLRDLLIGDSLFLPLFFFFNQSVCFLSLGSHPLPPTNHHPPPKIHLVYHVMKQEAKEAVIPSLFRPVHFGWITPAVEIIACPNYEFICCGGFQTWCGENSPEQNQTVRGGGGGG